MVKNRGTHEGDFQEISFVKAFNKNKKNSKYSILTKDKDIENLYMVRVTTNQFSALSKMTTKTRADCYLINCKDEKIHKILMGNDFYLSEDKLSNLQYQALEKTGVSIKLLDAQKYQILKITPNSFFTLFNNYELGAGASLFCLREEELPKNNKLLKGWNTSVKKMIEYFNFIDNIEKFLIDKEVCQKIKKYCNKKIVELIDNSKELKQIIFNGYPIYKEPYSAWFLYANDVIKNLDYIPFNVTTGSGRSHGDYTIVLKPKKEG